MNKILLSLLILLFTVPVVAQSGNKYKKITPLPVVCYASDKIEKAYISPPKEFLLKSGEKKSDFIVTYSQFPDEAKKAFEYAVSIWESIIESPVPIYVQANWRTMRSGVLGSASPADYVSNFKNAPHKDRYYPISLAEKEAKTDINSISYPDIEATFNKSTSWYYGTDGKTPDLLYDFVTVVLHEIAHGLGFNGFFSVSGDQGLYEFNEIGDATSYDYLVIGNDKLPLVDPSVYDVPSTKLYSALTGLLFANSPSAIWNNNGNSPQLYAPSKFDSGSSIYHLNDENYPVSSGNSLMTHAIGRGEAVHDPGPLTKGILADIGWSIITLNIDRPKDIEEIKPIVFNISVESEFGLDTSSLILYYSTTGFENHVDSLLFIPNKDGTHFSATVYPKFGLPEIQYYITATDNQNRTFLFPGDAPSEFYSVKIGPDNEAPEIVHTPVPYFIADGKNLKLETYADDNLGIDTVYVEYSINGVTQNPFGLKKDSETTYSSLFNIDLNDLNDGDEISYHITAIDSSVARNNTTIPQDESFSFKIQKIFDPVVTYFNDFNNPTSDFILSDFDIYQAKLFNNAALQSPHPYPSPEVNNAFWNFSTQLKRPVILLDNAIMAFDEIVLVEPGEVLTKFGDEEFWDYVIVEGSKDKGETWLPLTDGYDSRANSTWEQEYNDNISENNSTAVAIPEWYMEREINMLENGNFKAGDTIRIRFRLYSDPFANGWGWTIDNLQIQKTVSSPLAQLSPKNIRVYPNPANHILNVNVYSKNTFDKLTFELSNLSGQKISILQQEDSDGEIHREFDLSGLPSGMYFLTIKENGSSVYSKKIVKN